MITITEKIRNLLQTVPEDKREEVLSIAWNACCDGSWLAESDIDYDVWSHGTPEEMESVEMEAVAQAIESIKKS